MALKKSELYSSLWSSCDELRGGMDASQYKDYVLVLLFIKYVSDKYAGVPYAPITIPPGAGFKDMVALKGKSDIGDQINKKIIGPLANANKLSDMPDFNDPGKLGSGKEMVERLTNLIAIFENKSLDFSKNRADGDDILGDAYEYLMRHFATESGKSKGQFYTPAEVSRVIAQIIGIHDAETTTSTTVYDPTCGSGSLLLKVGDEAGTRVTLYGQEKDAATSTLARMNMILHNNPTALIEQGNTLSVPKFKDGGTLKTFDYVVANPPFSDKRWSTGIDPAKDEFERFKHFGVPPAKQGDYAYLLHIVRSLKSTGKGACILPHGVLFRGNAEAEPQRAALYKATASLVRAYSNIADELEPAGYSGTDVTRIKGRLEHYLALREIIRKASGESLDPKAYEADMRHLIDTYIEADGPRKISPFDNMGLLELIVNTGIADAIAKQLGGLKGNKDAIAETIENNVRSKIIKGQLTDPAFFEKMSTLLDEIIATRKAKAIEYEEYLKRIAELAKRVEAGQAEETPKALNTPGKRALYNNLNQNEELAVKIDQAIRDVRPDGWRGVQPREQVIKAALYDTLRDVNDVERIFLIIKAQSEY